MINIFNQSIAFGNTTSISKLKSDIEEDLKNSIPQESKNYSIDNVFLVTHRWQIYDNFPLAIKPEYYSDYTKETFDGVLVVEGNHNIVVAKDDVQLPWAPGTNAFTLDSNIGKYSYNVDPHNVDSNTNTGNTYFWYSYSDNNRRDLMSDFNGRQYTQKIFSDDSYAYDGKVKWKDIPDDSVVKYAPGYCYKYSTNNQPTHTNYPISSNSNNIYNGIEAGQWWLPSTGELWMMYSNFNKINYCMSLIGGKPLVKYWYWSSNESGSVSAWNLNFGDGPFSTWFSKSQHTDGHVRPVSAFNKNKHCL